MVWRSVVISRPARLKREHFALVVEQEQSARVPFEDIAVIVLNHREITLTHPVLSACADYGIGLYSTGDNHQPNGIFMPFLQHSRATRMQRLQLGLDKPSAKRAWARIVQAKIGNQARCMELLGVAGERRAYTVFRRFLLNDGYDMIQFSVYGRILNGSDAVQKHMQRLLANLPPEGSVRVLTVTEKQFASMKLLVGLPLFQEKKVNANQMALF